MAMQRTVKRLIVGWLILMLAACSGGSIPVVDRTRMPMPASGLHKVRIGETLYSIAWKYGLDYKALARSNRIGHPYLIRTGQQLRLSTARAASRHVAKPKKPSASTKKLAWRWPVNGKVMSVYGSGAAKKGINISGRHGQSVLAAQAGQIVYAGSGIRGYGNLVIVKHDAQFLSAYAHNSRILIKEGQRVKVGQKIAEVGKTGNVQQAMLHFEIRRSGQPVNPLKYLPRK